MSIFPRKSYETSLTSKHAIGRSSNVHFIARQNSPENNRKSARLVSSSVLNLAKEIHKKQFHPPQLVAFGVFPAYILEKSRSVLAHIGRDEINL